MDTHIEGSIIKKFHSHPISYLRFYVLGVLIAAIGVVWFWQISFLGIFFFILGEVLRRATTYYLLDTGVARGYNLLATSRKYLEYENIQNVEVSQSFFQNIMGIGDLRFDTSGSDQIEVYFVSVTDPYRIEKIVREKMAKK